MWDGCGAHDEHIRLSSNGILVEPVKANVSAPPKANHRIAGCLVHDAAPAQQSRLRLVRVTPASPEMMQLLRDEYGLMADMIKVQIANEKGSAVGGVDRD
jgi:hypothetical protein